VSGLTLEQDNHDRTGHKLEQDKQEITGFKLEQDNHGRIGFEQYISRKDTGYRNGLVSRYRTG
jgi:hypothetical protein